MAKISGLTELAATPADNDEFVIVDVSDTTQAATGTTKRLAASRVVRTGAANTFTAAQKFGTGAGTAQVAIKSQAAGTVGLVVDTAASPTASLQEWRNNGTLAASVIIKNDERQISLAGWDNGSSRGARLILGNNTNASTPASGHLEIQSGAASDNRYRIWVDRSGNMRLWNGGEPAYANDGTGTVVGTQTSQAATKDILGDGVSPADALAAVLAAPVYRFKYKSGAYNNTEFHGITTDDSPEFGMDAGRVFNPVSAFGYMVQTVKALHARIQQLEEQIANG